MYYISVLYGDKIIVFYISCIRMRVNSMSCEHSNVEHLLQLCILDLCKKRLFNTIHLLYLAFNLTVKFNSKIIGIGHFFYSKFFCDSQFYLKNEEHKCILF